MQCTSKNTFDLRELIANQDRFQILQIQETDKNIQITLCSCHRSASCTLCSKESRIIRSYYSRRVQDLPMLGSRVVIQYIVRRFRCDNQTCVRKIFSEQQEDFIAPYSRRTNRATQYLGKVLIEVSANKGKYISSHSGVPISASTCLRLVKNMPIEIPDAPEVIGIDDYAKRKGIHYGSIIVNMQTGRAIDMIDSRETEAVSQQLVRYQKVNYVTRDRSGSYALSIRTAIAHAEQIADKFHLLKNFNDHIYKEIRRSYGAIKEEYLSSVKLPIDNIQQKTEAAQNGRDTGPFYRAASNMDERKISLAADIDRLSQQGLSIRKVAQVLNIARNTVRSYLKESDHHGKKGRYINSYIDYIPTIITKIKEGYNIKQIYYHIVTLGFRGKISSFYEWFKSNIKGYNYNPDKVEFADTVVFTHQIPWHGLSPRKLALTTTSTSWGVDKKTGECSNERSLSQKVLGQSPLLQQMQGAYASFRRILISKQPHLLDEWISTYDNSAIKSIQSFIRGIKQDQSAVENAIRYPWTNSTVEGNVNRLKNKKREMYGRAGFELLKRKVILSVTG